jgi:hypothetical protein
MAVNLCGPGALSWPHLMAGFTSVAGQALSEADLVALLAMNHFYCHQRALRKGYPPSPEQLAEAQAEAPEFLTRMAHACRVLADTVDLERWLPSAVVADSGTMSNGKNNVSGS